MASYTIALANEPTNIVVHSPCVKGQNVLHIKFRKIVFEHANLKPTEAFLLFSFVCDRLNAPGRTNFSFFFVHKGHSLTNSSQLKLSLQIDFLQR